MIHVADPSPSQQSVPSSPPRRARGQAAVLLVVLIPIACVISFALSDHAGAAKPWSAAALTLTICLLGGAMVLRGLTQEHYPHARLGLCNVVTLTRATGIAVLAGLVIAPAGLGWGVVLLAASVLFMDLVDGWAARRSGLRSDFGARFDVETDVAFAVILALLAWQTGKVGVWFLALGALRPAFLLARGVWPWLGASLPDAMWRKTVAAVQMIAQVVLLAPILAPPASTLLGAAVLTGVVVSFGFDIMGLYRRRMLPGSEARA